MFEGISTQNEKSKVNKKSIFENEIKELNQPENLFWLRKHLPKFANRLLQGILVSGAILTASDKLHAQFSDEEIKQRNLLSQESAKDAEKLIFKILKEKNKLGKSSFEIKDGNSHVAKRIGFVETDGKFFKLKVVRPYSGNDDGRTEYWEDVDNDGKPDIKVEVERNVGPVVIKENMKINSETENFINNQRILGQKGDSIIDRSVHLNREALMEEFDKPKEERSIVGERTVYLRDGSKWVVLDYKNHKRSEQSIDFQIDFEYAVNLLVKDLSK